MREFFTTERKKPVLRNLHFWAILLISSFLLLVYLAWPWRDWNFSSGLWQWLAWMTPLYHLALFEVQYHIVGSLFLIPIIYASAIFRWQGSLVGSLLMLAGILPILFGFWGNIDSRVINIVLLLSPVAIVLAIEIELELRRKNKKIFIEREKEYQAYLTKILETQEKERRRIAEELHDESVQTLLAVASYAESIELTDDDLTEIKNKAQWIKEKTRSAVEDLRRMSIDLRPGILDDMGLISALRWLTNRTNKEKHIRVHLGISGLKQELNPELETNVFRIVQEALHNIEKHAQATDAFINLDGEVESLKIMIQDNGQGFILPDEIGKLVTLGKLGLIGMQERAKSLGGTFEIQSKPSEGTLLSINIPYLSLTPQPAIQ